MQIKRRWFWDQTHKRRSERAEKGKKGTEVIFVPGSHDEAICQAQGQERGQLHYLFRYHHSVYA
ncbi:hypothetical protein ASE07_14240 [Noviherbaspirillum sp. Root189]|nr:hypothetical protein ASE07_14240 [Noviherbaspirillum sp. Root189]